MKDLTFVLCSRNDGYGRNPLWRLQTSLNFLAHHATALGILERLEVIVSDWGSDQPLRGAVRLSEHACQIVRFVEVPVAVARARQHDSVFAEVIANNTAIRRASGNFIARIDQDTLVGPSFLSAFLDLVAKQTVVGEAVEGALMFVGRRSIPYSFARASPPFERVLALVERCGPWLPHEGRGQRPWFDAPVGAIVLHRRLWSNYRGYDESLRYWGFMETDLALRLQADHGPVVDLEHAIGCDFYHLAHCPRWRHPPSRRTNVRLRPSATRPNDAGWGLGDEELELRPARVDDSTAVRPTEHQPVRARELTAIAAEIAWQAGLAAARTVRGALLGDRIE